MEVGSWEVPWCPCHHGAPTLQGERGTRSSPGSNGGDFFWVPQAQSRVFHLAEVGEGRKELLGCPFPSKVKWVTSPIARQVFHVPLPLLFGRTNYFCSKMFTNATSHWTDLLPWKRWVVSQVTEQISFLGSLPGSRCPCCCRLWLLRLGSPALRHGGWHSLWSRKTTGRSVVAGWTRKSSHTWLSPGWGTLAQVSGTWVRTYLTLWLRRCWFSPGTSLSDASASVRTWRTPWVSF